MAIDMIEKSDFGNFTEGKLGLKYFADDHCENYFGEENFGGGKDIEQYFNLFGSKTRKDSIANVKREQNEKWGGMPVKTCADIKKALGLVAIDIEKLVKMSASQSDFWIQPALEVGREWEANFKKMQLQMNCLEIEAQEKAAKEKADTLATLEKITDTGVEKTKADIAGLGDKQDSGDKVFGVDKKTVMYAGAGLGVILLFALILRK